MGFVLPFSAMRMELWAPAGVWISQGDLKGGRALRTGSAVAPDRDAPSGMLPLTQDGTSLVFWVL